MGLCRHHGGASPNAQLIDVRRGALTGLVASLLADAACDPEGAQEALRAIEEAETPGDELLAVLRARQLLDERARVASIERAVHAALDRRHVPEVSREERDAASAVRPLIDCR